MLQCPKCKNPLVKEDHRWCCAQGHSFDIAKRGYVNLVLGSQKATGDDKEMVRSRTCFLSKGYYQPLSDRINAILQQLPCDVLVDAGCGEGYYTNRFREVLPDAEIYGFDLSKHAVDEACKAHHKITYGVCSVFSLPLPDNSVDVLVSIFAPIDEMENVRVLKSGGYVIKVGPGPKHLLGLKEILYENVYYNDSTPAAYSHMRPVHESLLSYELTISNQEDIWALFQMTPYYWKTPVQGKERLKDCNTLTTTVEFHIEIYQKP